MFSASSHMQPHDNALPTRDIVRCALILRDTQHESVRYLFWKHNNPLYKDMTAFPNTSLSLVWESLSPEEKEAYVRLHLLEERAWYKDVTFVWVLSSSIVWKYRKPDQNYNIDAIYKETVFVADLLSEEKSLSDRDESHTYEWYTADEIESLLQPWWQNGSSYLIWQAYKSEYLSS